MSFSQDQLDNIYKYEEKDFLTRKNNFFENSRPKIIDFIEEKKKKYVDYLELDKIKKSEHKDDLEKKKIINNNSSFDFIKRLKEYIRKDNLVKKFEEEDTKLELNLNLFFGQKCLDKVIV